MFSTPVQVAISRDRKNRAHGRSSSSRATGPGLLFQVAKVFDQERVALQNAKIATVGERAEDVFFVTTIDNQPLDEAKCERLGKALREGLADARQ